MENSFQLPLVIGMLVTVHVFLDLIQTFKGAKSPLYTHTSALQLPGTLLRLSGDGWECGQYQKVKGKRKP